MTKKVCFDELSIREYPFILGDNPACSCGAPVSIGWKYQESYSRNLDLYEYTRAERKEKVQRLPVQRRAQILLNAGYSLDQIASATMKVDEVKKMRADSLKASGLGDRAKLLLENTGKLPKELFTGMANLLVVKPTKSTITARSA
mmetsp:Transcript_4060/g.7535  ORF Transcript_4060/g.7535 Transcript_4060/m.7535 type:complete len:145 (+) Transcript_4060:185-619(+)|eukprot:CAMPEP_0178746794 /NCGR_PEP_ID=MMETSP0744-20121128/7989_1 /TAXON_ID=913974 /ORGANISM="Nitzschia punctata, Strain CCMP561" /LENGTH=144 /DNA_ID=CAMNT_0020400009 /DNA_START=172 /DNA_END=606 /DNA_ORIENTATION=+